VVAVFLADLEPWDVRYGQLLAAISTALKHSANQILVLPGKSAEQDGHFAALLGGKRSLHGAMEMCGLVQTSDLTQPDPFGFQALLDFLISVDLHEIRRH